MLTCSHPQGNHWSYSTVLSYVFFSITTKSYHSLWWAFLLPIPSSLLLLIPCSLHSSWAYKLIASLLASVLYSLGCTYGYQFESEILLCFFPTQWSSVITLATKIKLKVLQWQRRHRISHIFIYLFFTYLLFLVGYTFYYNVHKQ